MCVCVYIYVCVQSVCLYVCAVEGVEKNFVADRLSVGLLEVE